MIEMIKKIVIGSNKQFETLSIVIDHLYKHLYNKKHNS